MENAVRLTRIEEERGKPSRYRIVRANGGYAHHAIPFGHSLIDATSLCGHTPARNARMMAQRGRWVPLREGKLVTCIKCQAAEALENWNRLQDEEAARLNRERSANPDVGP